MIIMKYLITGATGHLGRLVVQELSKQVPINNIRLGVHTPAKATGLFQKGWIWTCNNRLSEHRNNEPSISEYWCFNLYP